MKSNLKRTLFISAAALGLFALMGAGNAQSASAKTYAKVTSNQTLAMNASDRNVNFTGSKALYTKAGTLKGAKVVASKSTLSNLSVANTSQSNVRAYRVAKTNRGSIYYKVVTFDGQYRGWIYGGKSNSDFGGGLIQYATAKPTTLSSDQQSGTFTFANPGTANDNKTVTYKQPAWTQYKIGRQITDSTPYANKTFKIDQAATRTREGDTWVHISATDSANSAANGWILYSGLKKVGSTNPSTPSANNSIKISLADPSGNVIKTISYTNSNAVSGNTLGNSNGSTWSLSAADTSNLTTQINQALAGTGYSLSGTTTNGSLTSDQITALAQAKFGGAGVTIKTVALNQATLAINPASLSANSNQVISDNEVKELYANIGGGSIWGIIPQMKPEYISAAELYADQLANNTKYKTLMGAMNPFLSNTVNDITKINAHYLEAAKTQYLTSTLPTLHGMNGDKITAANIASQATGLKSPLYPQFEKEGGFLLGIGAQYVLRWYQISYTPTTANSDGTYGSGNSVTVNYTPQVPASTNYVK